MNFKDFKIAVAMQFERMKDLPLYRTAVSKDLLWEVYLSSFPPGSNPMVRERTEYDCQSCRSFIRAAGSMIAVKNGEFISLWDCFVSEPYATVARAMSALVKGSPIDNVFLHEEPVAGVDKNFQATEAGVLTWEHFYLQLPPRCTIRNIGSAYGDRRTTMEMFQRALSEISLDAINTVVELISQGSLYRGEEHLFAVSEFRKLKVQWDELGPEYSHKKDSFVWSQDIIPAVARIRNTAIGTLLVDLAEGKELDDAVRMFESKVAPTNYKRPTAVVTESMVKKARATIDELGYRSALDRRFATARDVTVNNVLFANRDARRMMNADPFDGLASVAVDQKKLDKVEKITVEKFLTDVLCGATRVELLLENRHAGNLVNLVAPTDPGAKLLFKWPNNFSWAYRGDLTDSIKERVKARGGSVIGDFRASLAWFNSDDLDLHLEEPNGEHIYYGHKQSSFTGGVLDVDMNVSPAIENFSRNAVENITYARRSTMPHGRYKLTVNNYTHRESIDVGFEVEVEFDGTVYMFALDREVKTRETVEVATFFYDKDGFKIVSSLPQKSVSKELWGLKTQEFHPVTMIMRSPNFWDDRPVGNQHLFFMLQDCVREGSSRGFFNEYLREELSEHRKVFEILGGKMRTEESGEQLSGVGFSSTQRNNVYVKVVGAFSRTLNVVF